MNIPILGHKITKTILISTVLLVSIIIFQSVFATKSYAAYEHGRLIDNSIFLDAKSMSASQIQSFLNDKTGVLKNRSFKLDCDAPGIGGTAKQLYLSVGAPCGSTIPASQIIYYTAQVYGVNPKVILATLQKEQSLITNPSPASWNINQAMGYNCPTSGVCDSASGFFWQIDNGTWVLRYHYERANRNNSWWDNRSWTCGTAKPQFYTPNLYPGQNVDFHDIYSGVHYVTVYIHNAATSALYCYTPHVFNNHSNSPHPQESKNPRCYSMHPASGNRGRCYTGSYNFVTYFETWFGSTKATAYKAEFVRQSSYPNLFPGENSTAFIDYRNTGESSWYDSVNKPAGQSPVHLAATNPINRSSAFGATWGGSKNRPATRISKVFEANGVNLAGDQSKVLPGQIARFEFTFTVPSAQQPGAYREWFQPILEGASNWNIGGQAWLQVNVVKPTYRATYVSQSPYPTIRQNDSNQAFFKFKNTGNTVWHDATSARASGSKPVVLAATNPINRKSRFNSAFHSSNRPAVNFSAVYESDGVTLASNQHQARPGQVVKFDFTLTAPQTLPEGIYREWFQPILEGGAPWDMGQKVFLDVRVTRGSTKASFRGQSSFPTIQKGTSANAYFSFKNTGNTDWYDGVSAHRGIKPVVLAATNPINRKSRFNSAFHSSNRPAVNFSAVYESDGVTLASNQHVVKPGQIGRFNFTLTAPADLPSGTYREWFQPILEGGAPWDMVQVVWLDITVP